MRARFFALSIVLFSIPPQAHAACPPGYTLYSGSGAPYCRADLPSNEFFYSAVSSVQYPVCGTGRVPLTADVNYSWSRFASSSFPRSSHTHYYDGANYSYVKSASGLPVYGYQGLEHCACVGKTFAETPQGTDPSFYLPLAGAQRVLPDHYDVIKTQTHEATAQYGMVAIANDNQSDGRDGSLFSTGKSKCSCPNLNEVAVSTDPTAGPNDPVGVRCVPAVAPENRILTVFNPAIHDPASGVTQVLNRPDELTLVATSQIVSKVRLPNLNAPGSPTQLYDRKIWTCASPFRLDLIAKKCVFYPNQNACSEGDSATGVLPSQVSPFVTGATQAEQFRNAVNKKLGACLNEFGGTGSFVKFDCIENGKTPYSGFNELWSSFDSNDDGGQINSFAMTNAGGKNLTGFFKLDGSRCNQYSEFAGDIQPGKLTKNTDGAWTFTSSGEAIPHPDHTVSGYHFLVEKFLSQGVRVPQTPEEKLACPILVRTAMMVACPNNPPLPSSQKTIEIKDMSGTVIQRRCSAASNVQVQFRIEQVWEIEKQPKIKTIDSLADRTQNAVISVAQVTAGKYGLKCPPGTFRQGDACVY